MAKRFARIAGISLADSAAIVQSFRNRGLLGQNGFLLTNDAAQWAAAVPPPFNVAAYSDETGDQLMATYAGHKFYSDDNARTLAFFKARLQ